MGYVAGGHISGFNDCLSVPQSSVAANDWRQNMANATVRKGNQQRPEDLGQKIEG